MAKTDITISITTPTGINIAEALRLFTDHHNYREVVENPDYDARGDIEGETQGEPLIANPEGRGAFAKRTIARAVSEAIKDQKTKEAREAIDLGAEITVD
jgi:hypothetical protein